MTGYNAHAVDRLIGEVFRLYGAIVAAGDVVAKPFGLTSARWQILGAIEATGNGTVSDLARQIGVSRQSVQRIVTEMVLEGSLTLLDNPHHRRAKKIATTETGRRNYEAVTAAWKATAERMDHRFGTEGLGAITHRMAELRDDFRHFADADNQSRKRDGDDE